MAYQIIDEPGLAAGLARGLGGGFNQGLAQGLEQLSQRKMQDIKNSKLENLLVSTGNYTPEEAKLAVAFGQMSGANPLEAAQMFQGGIRKPSLQDIINPQVQQTKEPQQLQQRLSNLLENRPEALGSLDLANLGNAATMQKGLGNFDIGALDPRQLLQQAAMQGINLSPDQQQNVINKLQGIQKDKRLRSEFERDLQDYLQRQQQQKVSAQQEESEKKLFKRPLSATEKAAQQKVQAAQQKERREYKTNLAEKSRSLKDDLRKLEEMKKLNESGKISGSAWNAFLENSGLNIPALLSGDAEQYQKMVGQRMNKLKDIYGARPTQWDAEQYLKTLPTLMNSPEGRKRLIEMSIYEDQAGLARIQAEQDLIKKYGEIPEDITEMADEIADKKIDQLYKKYHENLLKPVPAGSSKGAIIASALGGKIVGGLVGGIPKAIGSIAKGAAQGIGNALIG